ncbi:MAG: hypothetical protein ACRD2W_02610 [Acidimicrobiales bacterium]
MMAKAKKSKPSWLGDGFATGKDRNDRVVELMREALQEAVSNKDGARPTYDDVPADLVEALTEPLFDPLPRNSAAAEAAFVLTAFSLAEDRPLDLNPPSEHLTPGGRVSGDRTTSEGLSTILHGYHIPASKGALMSSTYRGGHRANQRADVGSGSLHKTGHVRRSARSVSYVSSSRHWPGVSLSSSLRSQICPRCTTPPSRSLRPRS